MTRMSIHCRYAVDVYHVQLDEATFIWEGIVTEKTTLERCFKSDYVADERDAIDACYDWIDERKDS